MKKPNITIAEDEWNCPHIRVEEDGIVLDMEEVKDSYEEMMDALIFALDTLPVFVLNGEAEVVFKIKQALKKAGCTE